MCNHNQYMFNHSQCMCNRNQYMFNHSQCMCNRNQCMCVPSQFMHHLYQWCNTSLTMLIHIRKLITTAAITVDTGMVISAVITVIETNLGGQRRYGKLNAA